MLPVCYESGALPIALRGPVLSWNKLIPLYHWVQDKDNSAENVVLETETYYLLCYMPIM